MDHIDVAILRELQRDARVLNKDLAAKVGVAQSTALERVRSLRRRGVVTGVHADVDLAALGRSLQVLVSIRLRGGGVRDKLAFAEQLAAQPEVVRVLHLSGPDDVLAHVAVPGAEHLRAFLADRVSTRPEVLSLRTTLLFAELARKEQVPLGRRAQDPVQEPAQDPAQR
ncbi:hypothetical protein BJP25_19840 [Actinokineospora bangkokensis]|uniref:HTH asnC-type domain-containing protein n=1 Tax=Actinokineospora bangkokensis TaxID=1193682 RepID=A0A1Q9LKX5_9PSEU|nr:hypothetical protein BJP25_19840 [Actinokineospora bangkokensis]